LIPPRTNQAELRICDFYSHPSSCSMTRRRSIAPNYRSTPPPLISSTLPPRANLTRNTTPPPQSPTHLTNSVAPSTPSTGEARGHTSINLKGCYTFTINFGSRTPRCLNIPSPPWHLAGNIPSYLLALPATQKTHHVPPILCPMRPPNSKCIRPIET